ncbi:hypothetical protein, partial [Burkholderia sp. Tr-860]
MSDMAFRRIRVVDSGAGFRLGEACSPSWGKSSSQLNKARYYCPSGRGAACGTRRPGCTAHCNPRAITRSAKASATRGKVR